MAQDLTSRSLSARAAPLGRFVDAALASIPADTHQPTTAPDVSSTGDNDNQSSSEPPAPGDQPRPGAPGQPVTPPRQPAPPPLPFPPSPPRPPDLPTTPEADTTTVSQAVTSARAVPRTVEGIDVDEYVRNFDHEMGSQIRRVEGALTGALPELGAPGGKPPQDSNKQQRRPSGQQTAPRGGVRGIDVSGWQRNVNWQYWWNKGKRFAYVKATEGTGYKNPYFSQQYNGSRRVGMIRGAYHFALPNRSSGAAQAAYFARNGGAWARDGKTLPGALDLEWNPYGGACYGKSKPGMRAWIRAFHDTYKNSTGRWPVIYSSTSWWDHCVGRHGFGKTVPLWIARYSRNVGPMPRGWNHYTFWQYSSDPIDQNRFNGNYARLRALANGR